MKLITLDNLKHFKEKLEELNATKEELANITNELNIAKKNIVPVGVIYPFGGSNEKVPIGYLPCDGRAVSRTEYSALFNVIGTSFGNGDNVSTFNVPDMRECVPVGTGTSGRPSIELKVHDTYTLGQFKDDQMQGHEHLGYKNQENKPEGGAGTVTIYGVKRRTEGIVNDGTNGEPRIGSTTHGKQVGVNYIIKY